MAIEVVNLVQEKDVTIKQIADVIQHDAALSSKVLKTVNSSFYGQPHAIGTISQALVILGLNSVRALALGFSLVNPLEQSDGFDHLAFWRRSVYGSAAARVLAKHVGLANQEEAFLGGLLQDVGMLAMHHTIGADYGNLVVEAGTEHRKLVALEQAALSTDHASIGAALAEHWKLPPLLVDPIRFHETPNGAPEDTLQLICCVAVGSRVADVFLSSDQTAALEIYHRLVEQRLGVPQQEADELLKAIHADTLELNKLFELPEDDPVNPEEILTRANDAMIQIILEQQQQTSSLEDQKRQLTQQMLTDGLTGVGNRRRFNEFITDMFDTARQTGDPLSLLFLDVDHFKKINDTYGHQTGDRVLVDLAATLQDAIPQEAEVARYGGEEFAVVLPQTDLSNAAHLAESVRLRIGALDIRTDEGQRVAVTVSIGVATCAGGIFASADRLIKAAEQGVYVAKASGRNCTRIFSPTPDKQSA